MSEYNKILNRDSSVSNLDSKDYPYGLDSISLPNQENQGRNQGNPGRKSSNQANQDKIKVQTFKQTEIGLIPKDWELAKLGDLSYITKLAGYEYSKHFNSYNDGGEIVVIRGTNITNNKLDLSDIKTIPRKTSNYLIRSKLNKGDLVFAYVGTIGPIYLIEEDDKFHLGPNTSKITLNKSISNSFIFSYFNSWLIKNEIAEHTSVGAQPSLSMGKIRSFKIILPPLPEQKAIAQVLSDTDTLIQTLEQKLVKKRVIKEGAMQQLLTPEEDWEMRKIGEIGNIITGSTPSTLIKSFWNGNIPWITPTDISNTSRDIKNSEREITDKGLKAIRKLPPNTLLVTCIASIGKNAILRVTGSCNQQINAIIPNVDFNVEFLYYLIENNKKLILSKAGITATLMVSKKVFSEIEFKFPDFREQTRIATILSDMDAEIAQLEQKLDKYKLLKQGLMQELLTGRIRLV